MIIAKIPANDSEAMKSKLVSLLEVKKIINFYKFLDKVNLEDKSTWKDFDLDSTPMADVYKKYGLSE